jgi:predicted TPR repeat methyltransferase/Flp pilus assembly protein TadD
MKRKKARPAHTVDELIAAAQQHAERGELADAEARYQEALAIAPEHFGVLTLLGLLLVEREHADGAIDVLERARDIAPDFAPVQLAIGSAYAAAGYDELAVVAMETAVKLDTTSTVPLERLAKHHITARRPREAIGVLRRILRRDPTHAHARFLLAGLTGEDKAPAATGPAATPDDSAPAPTTLVESPPAELIADLFDTYAPKFDQHLVEVLRYCVPKSLAALVATTAAPAERSWRVLDLGCGTGLAGVEVRAYARSLIGSDLSPRMIARARAREIYDELHVEDLTATLARVRDVDLIVAADVFIYVGALDATFAACATALRAGGLLAFSVERSASADVVLQKTLRYAHSDAYIRRLASAHGLAVERAEPAVLRVDNDEQPVHGVLYLLRR